MGDFNSPMYKMTIAYDGTAYAGFQSQPNSPSIQTTIEKALSILLREKISIIGASRTDAGVHALGQVAHFTAPHLPLLYSLNALLPPDIRILTIEEVPPTFHARYSALRKTYYYHLALHPDPFRRNISLNLKMKLDLNRLKTGAAYFLGTHDFTSFSNKAGRGCAKNKPIKTLYRLDLIEEGDRIRLEFEADGFLYKMVRNIVGTLLEVARGALSPHTIPKILQEKSRRLAGPTAPPHPLFLIKVDYE